MLVRNGLHIVGFEDGGRSHKSRNEEASRSYEQPIVQPPFDAGTLVLQPQITKLCQESDGARKWVLPQTPERSIP
jgi:hypothetical protein